MNILIIYMEPYQNYPEKPEYVVLEAMNRIGLHPKHRQLIGKLAVDFAFPELKLAVELDGEHHHEADKNLRGAAERDTYLKSMGWQVYRIPATRALQSPMLIAQSVSVFIKQMAPAKRADITRMPNKMNSTKRRKEQNKQNTIRTKNNKGHAKQNKKRSIINKMHLKESAKSQKHKKITKIGGKTKSSDLKNLILVLLGLLAAAYLLIIILNTLK